MKISAMDILDRAKIEFSYVLIAPVITAGLILG